MRSLLDAGLKVAIFLCFTCPMTLSAAQRVAPDLYLIPGAASSGAQPDGNSILIDAPDGLIVFDTGRHAAHTQEVIDFAVARGRPVRAIINSHWHLDHVGGNVLLRRKYPDVRVYASSALESALGGFLADYRQQLVTALGRPGNDEQAQQSMRTEIALIDSGSQLLPTDVVTASAQIVIAGRPLQVHLEHGAVTAGDVWVLDRKTGVLLAGDLVTLPAPFLDTACPSRWQQALQHLADAPFRVCWSRATGLSCTATRFGFTAPPSQICCRAATAPGRGATASRAGSATLAHSCRRAIGRMRARHSVTTSRISCVATEHASRSCVRLERTSGLAQTVGEISPHASRIGG
jgi:glyoxylase-like metal-dependent hydrolase (beta-lactamase superfamily II)